MINLHYVIRICQYFYNRGRITVNVWSLVRNSLHQTLCTFAGFAYLKRFSVTQKVANTRIVLNTEVKMNNTILKLHFIVADIMQFDRQWYKVFKYSKRQESWKCPKSWQSTKRYRHVSNTALFYNSQKN